MTRVTLHPGPNTRDHELEEVLYNFVSLMVIDVTIKKVVTPSARSS